MNKLKILCLLSFITLISCNDDSGDNPLSFDPDARKQIATPSGLTCTNTEYDRATITWDAVPNAVMYGYQCLDADGNTVYDSYTTETELEITKLASATNYRIRLKAYPTAVSQEYVASDYTEYYDFATTARPEVTVTFEGSVSGTNTWQNAMSLLSWDSSYYAGEYEGLIYSENGVNFYIYQFYISSWYWGGTYWCSFSNLNAVSQYYTAYTSASMNGADGSATYCVVANKIYQYANYSISALTTPSYGYFTMDNADKLKSVKVNNVLSAATYTGNIAATFIGYDSDGNETGRVTKDMTGVSEWTEVDLSPLGTVYKVEIGVSGSDSNAPTSICIDNLVY